MPRLTTRHKAKQNEKLKTWMYGRMKVYGKTQKELADILKVHPNTVTNKFKDMAFTYSELIEIFKYLEADNETILQLMK